MNEVVVVQRQATAGASLINALLGIWVIISPWVLGFSRLHSATWNNVATGGAVLLLTLNRSGITRVTSVLNLLLGGWLFASPFVLIFTSHRVAFWNNRILGIVIVVCALVALGYHSRHATAARPRQQ